MTTAPKNPTLTPAKRTRKPAASKLAAASPATKPTPEPSPRRLSSVARDYTRHTLVTTEYRQYKDVLMATTREGDPYPILPGRLDVDRVAVIRDVTKDLTPGEAIDTVFHTVYTPPGGTMSASEARVSAVDMRARDPKWPAALAVDGRVQGRSVGRLGDAIKAVGHTAGLGGRWGDAYATTGLLLRRDAPPAFLRLGAPALVPGGTDPTLTAELPVGIGELPGVAALALDDPNPGTFAADLDTYLAFLDTCPGNPSIPWAMLAQLALAPWAALPGVGRPALVLAGDTGVGKSALGGVITAAQSRTFCPTKEDAHCATTGVRHAKSSKIGIDRTLYPLNGMVAVVDDFFAGKLRSRDVDAQWQLLSTIGDSAATGSGGVKGTKDGLGIRSDRYPRACVMANAEDLPEEAERGSEVARFAALRMDTAVRWEVLDAIQANPRAMSRVHATMLAWGLADLDAPRRALAWARERVDGWGVGGHNRARQAYAQLMAGAKIACDHIERALELTPGTLAVDAEQCLAAAAADQAARVGMVGSRQSAREPVGLFVRHFRQMIAGDPWWLADADPDTVGGAMAHRPPTIPGHSPAAVGWRQQGTPDGEYGPRWQAIGDGDPLGAVRVREPGTPGRMPWRAVTLVIPAVRFDRMIEDVARRVRAVDGWSLPAPGKLRALLAEQGWLHSADGSSDQLWPDAPKTRLLRLDLGRLLDDTDADPDAGRDAQEHAPDPDPVPAPPVAPDPVPEPAPEPDPAPDLFDAAAVEAAAVALLTDRLGAVDITPTVDTPPEPVTAPEPAPTPEPPPKPRKAVTGAHSRPRGRSRVESRAGVLAADGVWLPGAAEPRPVAELPATLAAAYTLAGEHGVSHLYVMPEVAAAVGLPAEVDDARGVGVAHPWADLDGTGLTTDPERAGRLTPWINVWRADAGRKVTGRVVTFPHLTSDFTDDDGNMPAPADLAAALDLFASTTGERWYIGQAIMARQWATRANEQRKDGPLTRCEAIATDAVAALHEYRSNKLANLIRPAVSRPLTEGEAKQQVIQRYDRNSAYPSVYEGLALGIGEPEHRQAPDFDPLLPALWRASGPITGTPVTLPEPAMRRLAEEGITADMVGERLAAGWPLLAPLLRLDDGDGGGVWLTTPEARWFAELGILPAITEAVVWPAKTSNGAYARPLSRVGVKLRTAREALAAVDPTGDDPAVKLAYGMVKAIGSALCGVPAEVDRTGERRDWLWRPDWRAFIVAGSATNMLREVTEVGVRTGRWPVAAHIDAVMYTADHTEPAKAIPQGMTLERVGGGNWKPEGWASVARMSEHCGTRSFGRVWRQLNGGK